MLLAISEKFMEVSVLSTGKVSLHLHTTSKSLKWAKQDSFCVSRHIHLNFYKTKTIWKRSKQRQAFSNRWLKQTSQAHTRIAWNEWTRTVRWRLKMQKKQKWNGRKIIILWRVQTNLPLVFWQTFLKWGSREQSLLFFLPANFLAES